MVKHDMQTSASDYSEYRDFCKIAATNDKVFAGFRRNYIYTEILEHVTKEQGKKYIEYLRLQNADYISPFYSMDFIGSPHVYYYGKYGSWSPTTIRYIKVLADLLFLLKDLNYKKIIEVGGGYGGQANVLMHLNKIDYHIYDLPEPLMLTERFLKEFDRKITPHNALEPIKTNSCDLFLSNYAISELNKDIQDEYLEKIIPNSTHGYITYNKFDNAYSYEEFFEKVKEIHKGATIIDENPLTFKDNKVIQW